MKIVSLTPGTGNFHCGSCLRDHALVRALRVKGHDAMMVPMYLPLVVDDTVDPEDEHPIQFGGINVYLQQKSAVFRAAPRWIDGLFNARWMLYKAADRSGMTQAKDLADLTISMLRGEAGAQKKELAKLIDYLRKTGEPDIVSLSNGLLVGLAKPLREALGSRVICSLQGEDAFLDSLPPEASAQTWGVFAERCHDADLLIAASEYYARNMRQRLGVSDSFLQVVHNGISFEGLALAEQGSERNENRTIGYLARLCPQKGLHTLVDAFIELKRDDRYANVRLHVAGTKTAADETYIAEQQAKLAAASLDSSVDFSINLASERKGDFLRSLSILSVPATYGEAFGLYVIEALACGVPFVQPRSGAFGELLECTGGGILVEPDDASDLARGLASLLDDEKRRRALGEAGNSAVRAKFSAEHMATRFLEVCESVTAAS